MGVAGLSATPASGARLADLREHAVQVHARLLVHDDHVGAGGRELARRTLRMLDHEVHVEQRAGAVDERLQRLDDQRSDGDVGHEVAVHDVDVDDARAGVEHRLDVVAQAAEVGGQDGRRDVDAPQDVFHRSSDPSLPRRRAAAVVYLAAARRRTQVGRGAHRGAGARRRSRWSRRPAAARAGSRRRRDAPRPGQAAPRSSAVQPPPASSGSTTSEGLGARHACRPRR